MFGLTTEVSAEITVNVLFFEEGTEIMLVVVEFARSNELVLLFRALY